MSGLVRFRGIREVVNRLIQRRSVGTSNAKKSDTITTSPTTTTTSTSLETVTKCKAPQKIWVSYGYSYHSEELDRKFMHMCFFASITLLFTFGGWIYAYMPDHRLYDWAHREAYLELRRREQLGLPRIDINLIDPALVKLPTDEELRRKKKEIII